MSEAAAETKEEAAAAAAAKKKEDEKSGKCLIKYNAEYATDGYASIAERSAWLKANSNVPRVFLVRQDDLRQRISLRVLPRPESTGNEVYVTLGTLGLTTRDSIDGQLTPLTHKEARRWWLFQTTQGRLALIGLVLAIIAALISSSLFVGKAVPLIVIGDLGVALCNVIVTLLGLAGVIIVFVAGYRKQ